MFNGRPLPHPIDVSFVRMQENWVDPVAMRQSRGRLSGVMAISRQSFLDNYLIARFARALGQALVRIGDCVWAFSGGRGSKYKSKDLVKRYYKTGFNYKVVLSVVPGTNRLGISGRISSYYHYDAYTLDMGFLGGNDHTEWMYFDGHRDLNSAVHLVERLGGDGLHIRGDIPDASYFGAVVVDRNRVGGFAKVTNGLGSAGKALGLTGNTPQDILASAMHRQLETIRGHLDRVFRALDLQLNQQAFIPPGGGEFDFSGVRFSHAGDLLCDAFYK
jgi:hypothetical protein